jgi:DUF1680 family protein
MQATGTAEMRNHQLTSRGHEDAFHGTALESFTSFSGSIMRQFTLLIISGIAGISILASADSKPLAVTGHATTTTTATADQTLHAVPFTSVTIDDTFWKPRQDTNRQVSIPHSFDMLEKAGNIHDLELAASHAREGFSGPVFIDSDLYKAIEAAAYSLATHPDAALDARIESIISKIAAAQMPDGYLDTWYEVNAPDKRFSNLRDNHELYCAGHLIEAAVAYYAATGKRDLLNVAIRLANNLDRIFGSGPGKREGYCGHPEIELALMKLWRTTGDSRYFELSQFFLDSRGSRFFAREHNEDPAKYDGRYWQDNAPLREQKQIVGHAVRAVYLLSGATDLAAATGDPALIQMLDRVWENTTGRNMFITGGIGSSAANEGFTSDYDLPNLQAYQETCASVAMIMWNHRMNLLHADAKFADTMEQTLYNGFLAGVSLDGKRFFYVNPLESKGDHLRLEWYSCACCPPNVTRTLAQLGGYVYATSQNALFVNLYIGGRASAEVAGSSVTLNVKTRYPWDEHVNVSLSLAHPARFDLNLRIPGWCRNPEIRIAGKPRQPVMSKGYAVLTRDWKDGDSIELRLPMPVRQVAANPAVKQDRGRLAIQRGPIVYCLEQCDNTVPPSQLAIPAGTHFETETDNTLLSGTVCLKSHANAPVEEKFWADQLYSTPPQAKQVEVTAIPYALWDNRAAGEMLVWVPASL